MNLLCPACHTPLPAGGAAVVSCPGCSAEVDVTRAGTIAGRPRFVPEIDRTGTTVGGYQIRARLAGGGMGTVYRAAGADGKQVALKFLSPALAESAETAARFAREIVTLARLDHPAIVRVLAHGAEGGIPWFAMELVDGSDLRARIARGALPPGEAAAIFARLFAALAHAHAAGVVHRDLKPANVLLASDGARLADFGVARWDGEALTGGEVLTRLTETAAVIGTLPYMSPEQRRGGAIDRRSDLFSAGVMLYEVATGARPQGAFPPPSEISPAYGRAFDRLVMRLLQPDPARRPESAVEAATALAAALRRRGPLTLRAGARAAALAAVLAGVGLGGRAFLRRPIAATAGPRASDSSSGAPTKAAAVSPLQPSTETGGAADAPAPPFSPRPEGTIGAGVLGTAGKGAKRAPNLEGKRAKKSGAEVFGKSKLARKKLGFDDLSDLAKDAPPPVKSAPVEAPPVRAPERK